MDNFQNVKFLPWVGDKYEGGFEGVKILVLGESQYTKTAGASYEVLNADKESTINIIKNRIALKSNSSLQTFLNNNRMILGEKDRNKAADLWNNLAFYNFIQVTAGNSATSKKGHNDKSQIDKTVIENSRLALSEVLEELKPDLVIVWGKTKINKWLPEDKIVLKKGIWKLSNNNSPIFWNIKHPSRFFSWRKYHGMFKQTLEFIKNK